MMKLQKQPSRVPYKKGVFKNFTEIAGKRQCLTLFFSNVQASGLPLYRKSDPNTGVSLLIL